MHSGDNRIVVEKKKTSKRLILMNGRVKLKKVF